MASPTLVEQATAILKAATDLQNQLDQQKLAQPSLEVGGRKDWHDASQHPSILETRSALIDASQAMLDLALGPADTLNALTGPAISKIEVIKTLDTLGVAGAVPLQGEIALKELAAKLHVDARLLQRQLRFAYLYGLFRESREGFVAHTGLSAALPDMSPWLQVRLSPLFIKGVEKLPDALRVGGGSDEEVKIPVQLADAKNRKMWAALEEDYPPGEGLKFFSAGMKAMLAGLLGESLTPYVHGFDWASLAPGTVIDVGGGNGHVEATLLDRLPTNLNFIIEDLPSNAGPAQAVIEQHVAARERIKFQPHDFFSPQPAGLAAPAAYLLSRVLHDWRDEECVAILRHLLPAMQASGTKLLVCERVLPDAPGRMPAHKEQQLRTQDLCMFTLFGGAERTLEDWTNLFAKADGRLRIERLNQPLDSVFSFMQVGLQNLAN